MSIDPTIPSTDGPKPAEPVAISHIIQTLLVSGVTAQWFLLDDTIVNSIVTAIGAIAAVVVAVKARSKVKPLP